VGGPYARCHQATLPRLSAHGRRSSARSEAKSDLELNLGKSTDPTVEKAVIADVASYGKQLGRIEDALVVLLRHFRPAGKLLEEEDRAIRDLKRMFDDIADVKEKRSSSALRLCWPRPRGPDTGPSGGDQGTT
jgi:hypothetical protein